MASSSSSSVTLPACRYWDLVTGSWAAHGVVVLGSASSAGKSYVQCGSAHLTAFISTAVVSGMTIDVNEISPVSDAGLLVVRMC